MWGNKTRLKEGVCQMKRTKSGLLVLVVIVGMTASSCKTDGTNEWEQIAHINEIAGTWEGSFTLKIDDHGFFHDSYSFQFDVPIPATSVFYEYYIVEYEENSNEIFAKTKIVYDKLLGDTIKVNKGHTKDTLWDNLTAYYEPIMDYMNITIGKYYIIMENFNGIDNMDLSGFYLNSDKTRLKMVIPSGQKSKWEVTLEKK